MPPLRSRRRKSGGDTCAAEATASVRRRRDLVWQTRGQTGERQGFEAAHNVMVGTVGPDARLEVPVVLPEDLGGLHSSRRDCTTCGAHALVIETSTSASRRIGTSGTPVTISPQRLGGPSRQIYVATYDNAIGLPCGSTGAVYQLWRGARGYELIDLYPGSTGPRPSAQVPTPQLTYAGTITVTNSGGDLRSRSQPSASRHSLKWGGDIFRTGEINPPKFRMSSKMTSTPFVGGTMRK